MAALVQPNTHALDAGLPQPDAVRARLDAGYGQQRRMKVAAYESGGGNDGLREARKTIVLFSDLPTNLGNRSNRFPHSHRHDYDGNELNIPKTGR